MGENKTIFIVTVGDYSEYHICGVTFDRKIAENLQKLYTNDWETANIEEYPLLVKNDNFIGEIVPIYKVKIYADGNTSCYIDRNIYDKEPFEPTYDLDITSIFEPYCFVAEIKAKDSEHAIEHARDMRTKFLNEYLLECNENVEAFNKAMEDYNKKEYQKKLNEFSSFSLVSSATTIPKLDNISFLSAIKLFDKEEDK